MYTKFHLITTLQKQIKCKQEPMVELFGGGGASEASLI
jgi:hypothetical protein